MMRNGNVTLTVCETGNISYLVFKRSGGEPKGVRVVSVPHYYYAKDCLLVFYYSLDSVCSVVLCIKPETHIVLYKFQEEI